uniref:Uncharacterized protein n=1 Tax=Anguilla anguilla TaxID=7936 RepID=A0A0E9Q341_ANGAN
MALGQQQQSTVNPLDSSPLHLQQVIEPYSTLATVLHGFYSYCTCIQI